MDDFSKQRSEMVTKQLKRRGIRDERILDAFLNTPRHKFVPPNYQYLAYHDRPLPIGAGQTISQPYMVALMTQCLHPQPTDTVLEIGTGSGYQAAILSHLVKTVFTIEIHQSLIQNAAKAINDLGYQNVHILQGDGSQGLPDEAPFNAILITAAAPDIPPPLISQLALGGRVIAPVGGQHHQTLVCWTKNSENRIEKDELIPVVFVPLRGKHGWLDEDWPE